MKENLSLEGEDDLNILEKVFGECLGGVDSEIIQHIMSLSRIEHRKKGDRVVEAGEIQVQIPFLVHGILRGFLVDENGQDITDCFAYRRGDAVRGCNGLSEPSQINIETLTDCDLVQVPVSVLKEVMEQHPELVWIYNSLLEDALKRHWELKRILYQDAMHRYQWFLDNYPGLINHVSNKHVASFLGITPVTLSRLRRRLRQEQEETTEES